MKKILRYLLILLIVVILFIAVGIMLLVNFVDLNDYHDRLDQQFSQLLQKPVVIHGDINWQFFPNFGLVLHDISINADNLTWQARIKTARIAVHLSPLLAKHVSLSQLILDNVNLELTTETGSIQPNSTAIALSPVALPVKFFDTLTRLDLQKCKVTDSSIVLHQQLTQITTKLDDIRFEALNIGANKNTDIHLTFAYQADTNKPSKTTVAYTGQVHIDPRLRQMHCTPCTLSAKFGLNNHLVVSTDLHYQLSDQSLAANAIEGTIDGFPFQGQLQVQTLNQDPELNFSFNGATTHLADWLSQYGIDLTALTSQAVQHVNLKVTGSLLHHQLTLQPVVLQLDHSTLNGSIQSTDIEHGAFLSQFTIDKINAVDYVKKNPDLSLQQLTAKLNILLPIQQQSFALNGPLQVDSLTLRGIVIKQLSTLIDMKGSVINFQQSRANLLGGHYQGSSQIDLSAATPAFEAKQTFTAIQIQPLIHLVDPTLNIAGIATLNAHFTSDAANSIDFKKNLNAEATVLIKHGVLYGLDAGQWLNIATAQNSVLPVGTPFGDLSATVFIQKGVISNQDLLLKNPQLHIRGHGTVDLVQQRYDYHLLITPVKASKRFGGIPLWVTGSFSKPIIQLDTQALVTQTLKKSNESNGLSQGIDQVIHKLDFKHLFGN